MSNRRLIALLKKNANASLSLHSFLQSGLLSRGAIAIFNFFFRFFFIFLKFVWWGEKGRLLSSYSFLPIFHLDFITRHLESDEGGVNGLCILFSHSCTIVLPGCSQKTTARVFHGRLLIFWFDYGWVSWSPLFTIDPIHYHYSIKVELSRATQFALQYV